MLRSMIRLLKIFANITARSPAKYYNLRINKLITLGKDINLIFIEPYVYYALKKVTFKYLNKLNFYAVYNTLTQLNHAFSHYKADLYINDSVVKTTK